MKIELRRGKQKCKLRPNTGDRTVISDNKAEERHKCTGLSLFLAFSLWPLVSSADVTRVSAGSRRVRMIIRVRISFNAKKPQSHARLELTSIPLINTRADGKKAVIHQCSYPLGEMRATQLISFSE